MSNIFQKIAKYVPPTLKCAPFLIWNYGKTKRWSKHPEKYDYSMRYEHQRKTYLKVIKALHVDIIYSGLENVPTEPHMCVSNHQSYFDPFIVSGFKGEYVNIAKTAIAKFPFVGWIAKSTGTIWLDRENLKAAVLVNRKIAEVLTVDKHNIWMTAEGTRSKLENHEMNDFKPGSLKALYVAKCPVVPVCFDRSWEAIDAEYKKNIKVYCSVLKPIPYEEYKDMSTTELAEHLHKIVHDELLRLRKVEA